MLDKISRINYAVNRIFDIEGQMGRRKKFTERMVASFLVGTLARLDAVLQPGEDRTDLVREAVADKLAMRERLHKFSRHQKKPGETET